MPEKPIKVDEETDRLVSELAYFLRCTKKNIVREAVAEFAEARGRPLVRHPMGRSGESSSTPAVPSARQVPGEVVPRADSARHGAAIANAAPAPAAPAPAASAPASAPAAAVDVDVDVDANAGAGAAPEGAATFRELPLRGRLALRRPELIREFSRHGGSEIRIMGRLADRGDSGNGDAVEGDAVQGEAEVVELLVVTDILDGSSAEPTLEGIASRLLGAPCRVTSATALRLFDPEGLRRAMAESRPL